MTDTQPAQAPAATLSLESGLAHVELTRADALNAINAGMKRELLDIFRRIGADPAVRAVLITAQGRHFCVGQDLGDHVDALRANRATAMATVGLDYNPLMRALADITVPVVVGVQGACAGAGWGLAMTADIRVAGARTSFRAAFTGIGLAADSGLSHFLTRCLGPSRASGILMLNDAVTAEQALAWGLVHRVVDDDAIASEAQAIARQLADGPTLAFARVKGLVGMADGLDQALEQERRAQEALGASDDHFAAVEAFLAKKKPQFKGR